MKNGRKNEKETKDYILFDTPKRMHMADVIPNYKDGGAILYRPLKGEEDNIEILAYLPYNLGWEKYDYWFFLEEELLDQEKVLRPLRGCEVEILHPVCETMIDLADPTTMSSDRFLRDGYGLEERAESCMKVFGISARDFKLYLHRDRKNDVVTYYGYSIHNLGEETFREIWDEVEILSFQSFKQAKKLYVEKTPGKEEQPSPNKRSDIREALHQDMVLPGITTAIRRWLQETRFSDFCNAITDRVKGQEDVEMVVVNIYNYLSRVAYGKFHNNNILMAAPSGCGKTETYRAVKDYFAKAIPGLVIYQIDMTSITEEGFKGKNTVDLVRPLGSESGGIGIVFMDEFDKKLVPSYSGSGSNVNLAVQSQILTLIEGRQVSDKDLEIHTGFTMFLGMGAFDPCRKEKSVKETHIGFEQTSIEGEDHYANITREDMIRSGASYELIGRFSTVINYHKLSGKTIDEIINGLLKAESETIGCKVTISKNMRRLLHDQANGKFGCRILKSMIHDNALRGFLKLVKADENPDKCSLFIKDDGTVECRIKKEEACRDEKIHIFN